MLEGRDYLRELLQFFKCFTLGNAFGAECEMNVALQPKDPVINEFGDSRIDGAAQDQQ